MKSQKITKLKKSQFENFFLKSLLNVLLKYNKTQITENVFLFS